MRALELFLPRTGRRDRKLRTAVPPLDDGRVGPDEFNTTAVADASIVLGEGLGPRRRPESRWTTSAACFALSAVPNGSSIRRDETISRAATFRNAVILSSPATGNLPRGRSASRRSDQVR